MCSFMVVTMISQNLDTKNITNTKRVVELYKEYLNSPPDTNDNFHKIHSVDEITKNIQYAINNRDDISDWITEMLQTNNGES